MDNNEFIKYIKEDFPNFRITKDDLNAPSRPFIIEYYLTLLQDITRFNMQHLLRPHDEQLMSVQRTAGAISTDQAACLNLYQTLKTFFSRMPVTSFSYSDLIVPYMAPQRSVAFMMSFYQFYTLCAEFDERFEAFDKSEENKAAVAHLQEQIAKLKLDWAEKQEKRKQMLDRCETVKASLIEYDKKNEEKEILLKQLQQEKDLHSEQRQRLAEKEQEHQEEFQKIKNEEKYYESLVVSDPKELLTNHKNLLRKKEESKQNLESLELQVTEKSVKLNRFEAVSSRFNKLAEVLRDEVAVGGKPMDLKSLHLSVTEAQKENSMIEKEEVRIEGEVGKDETKRTCLNKELSQVTSERGKLASDYEESKLLRRQRIADLQRSLSEKAHKAQIEQVPLREQKLQKTELITKIRHVASGVKDQDTRFKNKYNQFESELLETIVDIREQMEEYNKNHETKNDHKD